MKISSVNLYSYNNTSSKNQKPKVQSGIDSRANLTRANIPHIPFCANINPDILRILPNIKKESTNEEIHGELYKMALEDKLTGLKNKRALYADLALAADESRVNNEPMTIIMSDFDNFKSINDILGYDIGDGFISTTAKEIGDVAKEYGYEAYRFGGEEFFIIMPNSKIEIAQEMAEKISNGIKNNQYMQSHLPVYKSKGKDFIEKLTKEQMPLANYEKALSKFQITESFYKEALAQDNEDVIKFMNEKHKESKKELNASFETLMHKAMKQATCSADYTFLDRYAKRYNRGEYPEDIYDDKLNAYIQGAFNNETAISQMKSWMNSVSETKDGDTRGFSTTIGIKEFNNIDINYDDYIKDVGAVLSNGKKSARGKIYSSIE